MLRSACVKVWGGITLKTQTGKPLSPQLKKNPKPTVEKEPKPKPEGLGCGFPFLAQGLVIQQAIDELMAALETPPSEETC